MFSVQQKRDISDAVQKILRATMHAELPVSGEISFLLHVDGAESWSWADIKNNGAVGDPGVNPHNELMASVPEEKGREMIKEAQELTEGQVPYMPDPRNTPDEFMKEMLENRLTTLDERVRALENHLPTQQVLDTMRSYDNRLENLEIAIRQLGSSKTKEETDGESL